jgi:hypothetical protein
MQDILDFGVSVSSVRDLFWALALASKHGEDRTIAPFSVLGICCISNLIFSEAPDFMMAKVGSRCFVLGILETMDTTDGSLALACSTWKKVARASFV